MNHFILWIISSNSISIGADHNFYNNDFTNLYAGAVYTSSLSAVYKFNNVVKWPQ